MNIALDELARALIRGGFFFPSQHQEALVAAKDIFLIISQEKEEACGPPI
jgi:hypothetical protein